MKTSVAPIALPLAGKLIVSCQASEGEPFRDPGMMAHFSAAAVEGGAAGIRANGPGDIRAIRAAVPVPLIGIQKVMHSDGRVLITPTFEAARALVEAGANMIALDCTARGRQTGALERLRRIRTALAVPVLADIATLEEAAAAAEAGADFVLSTMRGYTPETEHVSRFEPSFIAELVREIGVPAIAEGRILSPDQAVEALRAGAFAVVVGGAITRPVQITRRFASALEAHESRRAGSYVGIDLGATKTKVGIVDPTGALSREFVEPTPALAGRDALLDHLVSMARRSLELAARDQVRVAALGVATAGWVDPHCGQVVYATDNLPGWTGAKIAQRLEEAAGVPVRVENDANALAIAEKHFGVARNAATFVCITLGTGVGGGCYVDGRLLRGTNYFANALGHIAVEADGLPCTCGSRGCLEPYANAAALVRYAGEGYVSAEEVIQAAGDGNRAARDAILTYSRYLARGCATLIHLLDPEMLVFSGGLAQRNPDLLKHVGEELADRVLLWPRRHVELHISPLGYYGGVLGAAALAMDMEDPAWH